MLKYLSLIIVIYIVKKIVDIFFLLKLLFRKIFFFHSLSYRYKYLLKNNVRTSSEGYDGKF